MTKPVIYDDNFDKRFWECVNFCKEHPLVADIIMKSIIEGKRIVCERPGKCDKFPCSCMVRDNNDIIEE